MTTTKLSSLKEIEAHVRSLQELRKLLVRAERPGSDDKWYLTLNPYHGDPEDQVSATPVEAAEMLRTRVVIVENRLRQLGVDPNS